MTWFTLKWEDAQEGCIVEHFSTRKIAGIMEEPELQELVHIVKDSTISHVFKNSMGFWWHFKTKES